jgi:hypothetical protein
VKPPVLAVDLWHSNAHLIADVARLGYLRREYPTLDPTYGKGVFWRIWKPDVLVTHDIKLDGVDVRRLKDHHKKGEFPQVVFDPPYKLNGTRRSTTTCSSCSKASASAPTSCRTGARCS